MIPYCWFITNIEPEELNMMVDGVGEGGSRELDVNMVTCCCTVVVIDQTWSQSAAPSLTCYQFMQFGISTSLQSPRLTIKSAGEPGTRSGDGNCDGQLLDWDQLVAGAVPNIPSGDDGFFLFSCPIWEISGCVVSLCSPHSVAAMLRAEIGDWCLPACQWWPRHGQDNISVSGRVKSELQ